MMRLFFIAAVIFQLCTGFAHAASFPQSRAENLLGQKADFPGDLPGDPALILVAFKRSQQSDIDAWMEALDLKGTAGIAWIEMPVVGGATKVMKPLLDGWMRDGIPDLDAQARVFTLYSSRKRFKKALGVPKTPGILAVVAKSNGQIVTLVEGGPTPKAVEAVLSALGASK
ncbi:MAG: hypothetical protein AAF221_03395 [Pseudomonadota bacterium]